MAIICARLSSSFDIACRDIQALLSWQVEFEAKETDSSQRVFQSLAVQLYSWLRQESNATFE